MQKEILRSDFEKRGKNLVFKEGTKQVLLTEVGEKLFALDNRCPHEGYPLSQGTADGKSCVLTCNWHNWKFDLKSGKCVLGGDNVRTYPVSEEDEVIRVDLSDPSPEEIRDQIIEGFQVAFERRQYGRIAREVTRLIYNDLDPLYAVKKGILWSYDRFEYGTTHAYAALADWLNLYSNFEHIEEKVICLTESIEHIAYDCQRHPKYPFPEKDTSISYSAESLKEAVENEEHVWAESLVQSGLAQGLRFRDFEKVFSEIALAHYNDFGHSLIYVEKCLEVSDVFQDSQVDEALALSLIRSLAYATREDLIPEFRQYGETLQQLKKLSSGANEKVDEELDVKGVAKSYQWLLENYSQYSHEALYDFLLEANAENFLKFDFTLQDRTTSPVSQNIGWLSYTHALTFSNAVRRTCEKFPELWEEGLLQMMSFYGRNKAYTREDIALSDWKITSRAPFEEKLKEKILDHGFAAPIFSAHLLKTAVAVFEETEKVSSSTGDWLLAGVNRFVQSPLKQKHVRRMAHQAINLVAKDFQ